MPRVGIPLGTNYDNTRLSADSQKTVNMYPHSSRGFRQFPGLTNFGGSGNLRLALYSSDANLSERGLTMYEYDGTNWSSVGNSLSSADSGPVVKMTSLRPGRVVLAVGGGAGILKVYDFDGTDWAQVGSNTSLGFSGTSTIDATALNETDIALVDDRDRVVRCMRFNGTTFTQIGTTTSLAFLADPVVTKLSSTKVATTGINANDIRVYEFDGSTWTLESELTVEITGTSIIDICALSETRVVIAEDENGEIQAYDYDGASWTAVGDAKDLSLDNDDGFTITALDGSTVVVQIEDTSQVFFRRYTFDGSTWSNSAFESISKPSAGTAGAAVAAMNGGSTGNKGHIVMDGVLYGVNGVVFRSLDEAGAETVISSDFNGDGRYSLATDGTNLVIVREDDARNYTTSGGLAAISDGDLGDAFTVTFLDRRFTFDQDGTNADFVDSDINDPTSINTLNRGVAGGSDDDALAVFANKDLMYVFGETTTEPFRTTGSGNPPKRRQTVMSFGIAGRYAVDNLDNDIYILDNNRRPALVRGLSKQDIPAGKVGEVIDKYLDVSDCVVSAFTYLNQQFVQYSFPSANATWVYEVDNGVWFRLESAEGNRYPIDQWVKAYNKLLGVSYVDGSVFLASESAYQINGTNFTRTKHTGLITSELFGEEGQDVELEVLYLTFESTGAATVTVSIATEGDLTSFSRSRSITLAAGVQTVQLPLWGVMREGVFQIETSSNAGVDLIDAAADLTVLHG